MLKILVKHLTFFVCVHIIYKKKSKRKEWQFMKIERINDNKLKIVLSKFNSFSIKLSTFFSKYFGILPLWLLLSLVFCAFKGLIN